MLFLLRIIPLLLIFGVAFGGNARAQTDTLRVATSARCGMCKQRLESQLIFEKGIKKAELDLTTKVLTIWYAAGKTTPAALRTAVNRIGYDADTTTADPAAHAALPACCQKSADEH